MKILYYFYFKFLVAFFICLLTCSVIFYIFSLLGNLGENLSFISILYLSLINTLQIITSIPSMIVLLSIILFVIFLRSNNELMIFKEYVSVNRLLIILIPFALVFTIIDLNKKHASSYLEKLKINFVNSNDYSNTKVIISNDDNLKSYIILKNLDILKKNIGEFHKYVINENSIISGKYSDNVSFENNKIVTENYTQFRNKRITQIREKKIIYFDIQNLINSNFIINQTNKNSLLEINLENSYKYVFYIFFYISLFLILFNKIVIDRKKNFYYPIFISSLLFFYSLVIMNLELISYNSELQTMALILIFITFFKYYKYE